MLKYIRRFRGFFLDYYYARKIKKLPDGDFFMNFPVPSFTQWESKDLVDRILSGELNPKDDPLWQQSGAKTLDEYEMYSGQICGMTCLKMILKSVYPDKNYQLIELVKDAERHGVYRRNNDTNMRLNLDGLFHKKFLSFMRIFGFAGKLGLSVRENYIAHLLMRKRFVIASVHPSIREEIVQPNSKRGHLILIIGFRMENGKINGFFIHNPSGYFQKSQEKHFVNMENWKKCFSGNVDIINAVL